MCRDCSKESSSARVETSSPAEDAQRQFGLVRVIILKKTYLKVRPE